MPGHGEPDRGARTGVRGSALARLRRMNDTAVSPALRARLDALYEDGYEEFHRFDAEVRRRNFHPFVPADFPDVERIIAPLAQPGRRFLEWGSGMGVITIMAD